MTPTAILLPGAEHPRVTTSTLHLRRRSWATVLRCDSCGDHAGFAHVTPEETYELASRLGWVGDVCPTCNAYQQTRRTR